MNLLDISNNLLQMMQQIAPYRTGNLAINSTEIQITARGLRAISHGGYAPYNVYTNFPWTAARWNGKKNPNEGWFTVKFSGAAKQYLYEHLNEQPTSFTMDHRMLAEKVKDNPERMALALRIQRGNI
jgi:hypothetical protein